MSDLRLAPKISEQLNAEVSRSESRINKMRFWNVGWLCCLLALAGCGGGGGSEEDDAGSAEEVPGLGGRVTIQQSDGMIEFLPCRFEQSLDSYGFVCGDETNPPIVAIAVSDIPGSALTVNFQHFFKGGDKGKYRLYAWREDKERGGSVEHDRNARAFYFTMVDTSLWFGIGYDNLRLGQSAIIHGKLTY